MAQSTGMFPRYAAWVDTATTLPQTGTLTVPNLKHSAEVHFIAYFDAAAVGFVEVKSGATVLAKITAPAGGGKKIAVRSGVELGDVTSVSLDKTGLTAGAAQVSIF